ncbi:MAG: hypothetical protein WHV66_06075, partial [Anaerolineales bacterium]
LLEVANAPYVELANPIAPERRVLRRSLLASVLEVAERNSRLSDRLALFEIGPVFLPVAEKALPVEQARLAIVLSGERSPAAWDRSAGEPYDFYDLKGILEALFDALHINPIEYLPIEHSYYHPGKCARICAGEATFGVFGELHPLVKERYEFGSAPVLAAELDLSSILDLMPERYETRAVPVFPPVLEDIAVVVDENVPAERVRAVIQQAGGKLLTEIRLFDIFRGSQIGAGKKSMAYSLTYQAPDRTMTDQEAAQVRQRIIRRLEQELGAKIRSQ